MSKNISIVIPVFNEEGNIERLHFGLKNAINLLDHNYEIIYINDGSLDNTRNVLEDICKKEKETKVINFYKAYGQDAALAAGLRAAQGDVVIAMDGDLQDDPKDIKLFLDGLSNGYDIVCGWRRRRARRSFIREILAFIGNTSGSIFFRLKIHDFNATFKAYSRNAVNELYFFKGFHRFIPVMAKLSNLKIKEVEIKNNKRYRGNSKYRCFGFNRIIPVIKNALLLKYAIIFDKKELNKIMPQLYYEIKESN